MENQDLENLFMLAVEKLADENVKGELEASRTQLQVTQFPKESLEEDKDKKVEEKESQNLAHLIKNMSIPQRMKLAMFGNLTARTILLRDSNRLIPLFVLENPRLTENEIVDISKNTQLDDSILRNVANNTQWMKSYIVKWNIVSNPKTPIDVALKWLKFIKDKDLGRLAKSRNIPQVISSQAKKMIEKKGDH